MTTVDGGRLADGGCRLDGTSVCFGARDRTENHMDGSIIKFGGIWDSLSEHSYY
jgi:hypothetical protein